MKDILNRTSAPQIIRLYDVCFKQGVIDACEFGDDLGAKEFLDQHKADWTFGILGRPEAFDWQMFRFTLYWWARKSRLTGFAENYIFKIKKPNYHWCLLPYCMRFYLMGIEEWLNYPVPSRLEIFKNTGRIHWHSIDAMKKFTNGDYITYMHDFAYAYRQQPEENMIASSVAMDNFCLAVYDLTRKYVSH